MQCQSVKRCWRITLGERCEGRKALSAAATALSRESHKWREPSAGKLSDSLPTLSLTMGRKAHVSSFLCGWVPSSPLSL